MYYYGVWRVVKSVYWFWYSLQCFSYSLKGLTFLQVGYSCLRFFLLCFLSGSIIREQVMIYGNIINKYNSCLINNNKMKKDNSYFITKYGQQNVSILQDHLLKILQSQLEEQNFHEAISLRQKLQFIRDEKNKQFQHKKANIISKIIHQLQSQKETMFSQFTQQWTQRLQSLLAQMKHIQGLVLQKHKQQWEQYEKQINKYGQYLQKNQYNYKHNNTPLSLSLKKTMHKLGSMEEYEKAYTVKNKLNQEIANKHHRNISEWNETKRNKLSLMKANHQKEIQALRTRLQNIFQKQICARNQQQNILVTKTTKYIQKIRKHLNSKEVKWQGIINKEHQSQECCEELLTPDNKTKRRQESTRVS